MWIKNIELFNFRNFEKEYFEFIDGVNVIYGLNGQGKTNLIEAINYISTLNSFRNSKNDDLIKKENESSLIRCATSSNNNINISLLKTKKNVMINGEEIKRHRDVIGKVNVISFSSDDIRNFKDSPHDRRKFFDIELSKIDNEYVISLIKAKKILKQRNDILKSNSAHLEDYLEVLDKQLIDESKKIYMKRKMLINEINNLLNKEYFSLTGLRDVINLEYISDFCIEEVEEIKKKFKDSFIKDKEKGVTSFGIHKDDYRCNFNGLELLTQASSGQQRIVLLSVKLCILKIVESFIKDNPILILDDIFSELDEIKKIKLLEEINKKNQVFITTTSILDVENVCSGVKYFKIENGKKVKERIY